MYEAGKVQISSLRFDRGTVLLTGNVATPYGKWDPRVGCYRAKAMYYQDILTYLTESKIRFLDYTPTLAPMESFPCSIELRSYQKEALQNWRRAGMKGIIVLPTAAGKTYIALKAISLLKAQTLIVVPTLDLMDQWRQQIRLHLGIEAGAVGGGEHEVKMVTVTTYDSAYLHADRLGNKFRFLVFDEVHHLASPSYIQIAEMYIAPYRIGLTATYERIDERHELLPQLVGSVVYNLEVNELAGDHLSPFVHEKVYVDLLPKEREYYDKEMAVFKQYLFTRGIVLQSFQDFQKFIMRTGRDPNARRALLSRNRALKIALNSESKLLVLAHHLRINRNERTLIFTLHNDLVYQISRRFLIPAITYQTPKEERREILAKFRSGSYSTIVTSQVLDEGIDVPEASVGFIISGTGSKREYVQRLGRLLRKADGKVAKLIELVTSQTMEVGWSFRRHQ